MMFAAMAKDRERARGVFEAAQDEWIDAVRSHQQAPPDAGFSARLAALAHAADRRAKGCAAAADAGFEWTPLQPLQARSPQTPYELRPGTGRRGPEKLWERFDVAVEELNGVAAGRSMRAVGRAYAELAEVAAQLAQAVEKGDRASGLLAPAPRRAARRSV
jgi:hypothetical protein